MLGRINNMKLLNVVMQLRKVCNHPFLFDHPINQETGEYMIPQDIASYSGKMRLLEQLLPALFERGHKVLIFSQFTTMLDILGGWFEDVKGWNYCRIDGSVSQEIRQQQIKTFNEESDFKIFLLSTRAGGLGINLTSADTVIIHDSDWVSAYFAMACLRVLTNGGV
jgi:ATP-dependent DNA helicase